MPEWETVGYLDQGRLAPNGLYYIVCRLQHRHTAGRFGRGKFFHLSWLRAGTRDHMRHKLSRHADACQRVGSHPHVVINHSSTPVGDDGWWVVDQWIGPQTLQCALDSDGHPRSQVPRLLHELALGLTALHDAGVILRELAPARVLLSEKDGRAVLTDFELAKLLEGSPSVSSEWPEDPFRAPELDGGTTTIQADLYSFGRIALAAAASLETPVDRAPVAFGAMGMPKRLARYLTDCLHPLPSQRPPELAPLLVELARWAQR
jgi:serine/threonine protein kinase